MKKIIINENWEEEIIEDNSSFFVLIFTQGSNAGYIKAFSTDLEEILAQYRELLKYYSDTAFESFASIFVALEISVAIISLKSSILSSFLKK